MFKHQEHWTHNTLPMLCHNYEYELCHVKTPYRLDTQHITVNKHPNKRTPSNFLNALSLITVRESAYSSNQTCWA